MISKEEYIQLRTYLQQGANLPMVTLNKMAEFEEAYKLNTREGNVISHCTIKMLKCMPIPPSQ